VSALQIWALQGVPEIGENDALADAIVNALATSALTLQDGDILTVTSKVVSKSEGRTVPFDGTDQDKVRLILQESKRVLRRRGTLHIVETHHGFICANAGIDLSNTAENTAVLLPVDPDRSARRIRGDIQRRLDVSIGVIVTDTFGRVWRSGVTDIALGVAGIKPVLDLRGTTDATGRVLEATEVAVADQIAGAVNLVLGKAAGTPFALVRGIDPSVFGEGSVSENVIRRAADDLFR
jgi:coenzyme F420-0:L-glutamate ligase/coenzyme F420-1:gamma-L-glutamate ligase